MSGMAGIFCLDGAPADPVLLYKMTQALQYRGKDGSKVWHDGPLGLVHVHFWTTPEEVGEEQPISSPDGRLWITADARIDNREELIPLLRGYFTREIPSDVEIILAAYQRWGEDCAQQLVGDFSFAIWDAVARKLFLARDVIGIRQLYYATMDEAFYFGNTIGAVLAALPRQPALNRPLILEFLRGSYRRWICQTVYADIRRLPPAHHLVVDQEVSKPKLYYVLGSGPAPHCTADEEWLQAFRELFQEAVRCRLRSTTPIGISVSGGLDSSSVACMAHEIAQQADLPEIRLYSLVYRETPGADESKFFDAVAAHCTRFTTTRIVGDEFWALREFGGDGDFPLDEPEIYALRSQLLATLRIAAADGCRVMILGEGGDHLLAEDLYSAPLGLNGLSLRDWLVEARYFHKWSQLNWLSLFFRAHIMTAFPTELRVRMEALHLWLTGRRPWLGSLCVSSDHRGYLLEQGFYGLSDLSSSARVAILNARYPREIVRFAVLDVTAAYAHIQCRAPFWDLRLVNFLLHIPRHLTAWRGENRLIQRRSMHGILPEILRLRHSKGIFDELVHRGLRMERQRIGDLLNNSQAERMGFLRVAPLHCAFKRYWHSYNEDYRELLRPLYLEAWLRDGLGMDNEKGVRYD